jgi:hypothetical protein
MRGKKEPEILEKQIKKTPEKQAESTSCLLPYAHMSTPKASRKARASHSAAEQSTPKKKSGRDASAAETHAGMNRSTKPCTAAQIPPTPPRHGGFTNERPHARTQNQTEIDRIIKTMKWPRMSPTTHARNNRTEPPSC